MNDAPHDDPFDAEGFAQPASDPAPPQLSSSGDSGCEHPGSSHRNLIDTPAIRK
jgi:hypothetical protein